MRSKTCETCAYWDFDAREDSVNSYGECHRYPPTRIDEVSQLYPFSLAVSAKDWCGEWKAKEDKSNDNLNYG